MSTIIFNHKSFDVDEGGFLVNFNQWNEDFATGMASKVQISNGLTKEHWDVLHSIRELYEELGRCPLVFQVCRKNSLHFRDLQRLFPTGYLRGACKLAGITYKEGYLKYSYLKEKISELQKYDDDKTYRVDVRGFLVDPSDWDENFATHKAFEMKMPENLTEKQWQIIRYLRETYEQTKEVPTIYETLTATHIDMEELEKLFPDGYHRGAVKISGLRVR